MEKGKGIVDPVHQMALTVLVSVAVSLGLQHFLPESQTGNPMVNSLLSGLWGLFFSFWLVQFQALRALRRSMSKAEKALEAPVEAPKPVEEEVSQPVVVAAVEPVAAPVEPKVEAAVPAKKSVVIKKRAK